MKKILILLCSILSLSAQAQEKHPAFWDEVQALKRKDSIEQPAKGQILFIGSSSFTKWTDVQTYFPSYPILNRAFGGSTLADQIRYADDIIFKHAPKQIVLYCGENDIAYSDTITVTTVVARFKILYAMIRAQYPNIPFAYVAMKPSPSRKHLLVKYIAANAAIQTFLQQGNQNAFINIYDAMLTPQGEPMPEIFIEDNLHMNAKGYAIWRKIIEPFLKN